MFKKMMIYMPLCYFSVFFPFLMNFQVFQNEEPSFNTYLLSPGRSGTHLLMYTISYLTKKSCGDGRFDEVAKVEPGLSKIYQIHSPQNALEWHGKQLDPNCDILILIIRDFKEQLLRATKENYLYVLDILKSPKGSWGLEVFEDLEVYHNWNSKRRLLIYYEELIIHPERVCKEILEFLGYSDIYLRDFIDNYDYHFNVPLQYYHQTHGGSSSKGKDLHYHVCLLPKGVEEEMDNLAKKYYPQISEQYLKRYFIDPQQPRANKCK